jgi:trimeric autotransporter adhesin
MSTKTTFKRIALVAVAALGLGLVSVAPSNAAYSGSTLLASVGTIPYAGETVTNVASFTFTGTAVVADSTTITVSLTQKPSGSTLSNSDIVLADVTDDTETTFTANSMALVAATTSPAASVNVSLGAATLIAGSYTLTFTPDASAVGALSQNVSFNVTARPTDVPRLASINAVKAAYQGGADVSTGTVKDPVVVAAGAALADYAASTVAGTIRLRADLVTFPAGGYVNTFATGNDGTTALGNFASLPTVTAVAGSNLVTLTDDAFDDCQPTVANDSAAATYTASSNTIDVVAGCDNVVARAGSATAPREATGLGFFKFTPTVAGDYVLRIWQDADNDGVVNVNEVRRDITITIAAYEAFSSQYSTSYINETTATGVAAKLAVPAASCASATAGTQHYACDEVVVAPKGTVTAAVAVARVKLVLKDSDDVRVDARSTFPVITATITGSGTLAIDAAGSASTPVGRSVQFTPTSLLTNTSGPEIIYVTVFNDGTATSSTSSIEIKVGTAVFATETLSFYGDVATVTATQGRYVLPAATGSYGCVTSVVGCDSLTVAKTPAVKLVAKDGNGTAVPFRTYSAVSSATTTLAGISTAAPAAGSVVDETTGNAWFPVSVLSGSTVVSGATGTLTYSTNIGTALAPVYISGAPLTFTLGGAAASAALAISGGTNVGDQATMTFTVKDAAGNKAFDADHTLALKSNIALTTAIGQLTEVNTNALAVSNGVATINFFNPLVAGTVNITGLIDGLLAVSASTSVSNSDLAAAADLAAEALDAANAATDAANAAAEAADAATAAAQDAADAVAALATQVATYISNLRKQITALTNLVVKIQKKVKA